jgi:hypothetical protein
VVFVVTILVTGQFQEIPQSDNFGHRLLVQFGKRSGNTHWHGPCSSTGHDAHRANSHPHHSEPRRHPPARMVRAPSAAAGGVLARVLGARRVPGERWLTRSARWTWHRKSGATAPQSVDTLGSGRRMRSTRGGPRWPSWRRFCAHNRRSGTSHELHDH